jgi:ABC-type dipeptide/oligopeptide/nickel transport system permease component
VTTVITRRLIEGAVALVVLSVLVFGLSRATGDPLGLLLPPDASLEQQELMSAYFGLDQPLTTQYARFASDLLRGDLGTSIRHRQPVMDLFIARFPTSLSIILPAFALALLVGVPMGVLSSTGRNRFVRRLLEMLEAAGLALPTFWLAIVLIFVFSVRLQLLPSGRTGTLAHLVLPVLTLALFLLAGIMRLTRSSMDSALQSDYVRLVRLQGFPESVVVWKYALRNSLIEVVAFVGVYFSVLVTGSVVVEQVFAIPGVGRLLYEGILARDYPLIQGVVLISAAFVIAVNLAADLCHAFLDPRVRVHR